MTSLWLFHAMGTPVADQSSGELARTAGSRTNATNNSEHYTPTLKFHFALHHHFMHSCVQKLLAMLGFLWLSTTPSTRPV